MTAQSYIDRWLAENPFPLTISENGVERETTREEYDALLAERTITLTKQWERDQIEDTRRTLRQQVRQFRAKLATNHDALSGAGTLTAAQMRSMLDDVTVGLDRLIGILIDRNLIERDDG